MSKFSKKIFSVLLVTISCCQYFLPVSSLRCADECELDAVPFGALDPFKIPCQTIDINDNTTVCSVFLNIDYRDRTISAALLNTNHSFAVPSALHLKSTLYPSAITTFITYQCSTTDDCDQEFVREAISSTKWHDLDEGKLRDKLNPLLYDGDESIEKVICDNHLECEWFEHCNAELIQNNSLPQREQLIFNNRFPCGVVSDIQLSYEQYFHTKVKHSYTILKVNCNKNECNDERTVRQVYGILQRDFVLPLNYSQYIPITNGTCQLKISIFLFLFIFIQFSFF